MTRTHNHFRRSSHARGFTIIEIVMAFIIIGILVSVLVPTLSNRSAEAKVTAAQQELQHLADAMERCAIDTGYMVRIYALNDVVGGDGIPNAVNPLTPLPPGTRDHIQGILDNAISTGNLYTNPQFLFINPGTQDFAPNQQAIFDRVVRNETSFNWNGPYVTWYRDANHDDWPDDPWGADYLFFTIRGMIYPPVPGSTDPNLLTDHSFQFQAAGPTVNLLSASSGQPVSKAFVTVGLFDRPTFLSLGPNGLPGDGTDAITNNYGQGDDIVHSFGGGPQ